MRLRSVRGRLPGGRPLMIYDGRCSFCRRWIERWQGLTGDAVAHAPYQEVGWRFPEIGRRRFREAVQLVEPDGQVSAGAEAVLRSLAAAGRHRQLFRLYRTVPGVAPLSEWAYSFVASHRARFARLDRLLSGGGWPARAAQVAMVLVPAVVIACLAQRFSRRHCL